MTLEIQASEPSSTAPLIEAHKPVPTADCPHFIPIGNEGKAVEKPKDPQPNRDIRYVVPKTTGYIHDPRNQFVVPETTA